MPVFSPPLVTPPEKPWVLLVAAGFGSRTAAATGGEAKQFLLFHNEPLYMHAARVFSRSAAVAGIVFIFPEQRLCEQTAYLHGLIDDIGLPWLAVAGGVRRQDSVRLGLAALPARTKYALVHDAARPFVSPALIRRVSEALHEGALAVIPGLPLVDTIKRVSCGLVTATLPRDELAAVQTPQGFAFAELLAAHQQALGDALDVTDDAALMEAYGHAVRVVAGEAANMKITHPEDLARLALTPDSRAEFQPRTGMGYDVHRYGGQRPLILGGVLIPNGPCVHAHSDGDVLLHALMDALLGCACLGDIGMHFPDANAMYDGISSALLLDKTLEMVRDAGLKPCHIDMTIVAQSPRLAPYRAEIRKNVARLLALPQDCVNIKATTEEHLGFTGRAEGIKAYAVVTARMFSSFPAPLTARS